jgi:hypothetical protein
MLIARIEGVFPVVECTLSDGTRVPFSSPRHGVYPLLSSTADGRLSVSFSNVRFGRLYGALLFGAIKCIDVLFARFGSVPSSLPVPVELLKFGPGCKVAGLRLTTPQRFVMSVWRGRFLTAGVTLMEPIPDLFVFNSLALKLRDDDAALNAITRGLSDSGGGDT